MRLWLTILIAVILLSQTATAPSQLPTEYEATTLSKLLADPRANDGRRVRVHGFLVLEFEGNSLHPTEADFRAERYDGSVWIDVGIPDPATQAISGKLAFVSGVFDADHHGHMGLRPGALVDVTEITADPADKAFPRL